MTNVIAKYRRHRLKELTDLPEMNGASGLGELLGFKSGTQIGHMLAGRRPITEKTVARIESVQSGKFKGWFTQHEQTLSFGGGEATPPHQQTIVGHPPAVKWPFADAVSPEQWDRWVFEGGAANAALKAAEALKVHFSSASTAEGRPSA